MEQRSLRLGDIVDDYCPRERRVTNHAIVAIVGDVIRQTRCATCEAEHEYKEAKVPKKKTKPVLVTSKSPAHDEQPAGVLVEVETVETVEIAVSVASGETPPAAAEAATPVASAMNDGEIEGNGANDANDANDEQPRGDLWLHRPLIRATLPRTDNEPPVARPIPEFTMYQRQGRGFGGGGRSFRPHGFSGSNGNGSGQHRNPNHNNNPNAPEPDGNRAGQPGRSGRRRRRRRSR